MQPSSRPFRSRCSHGDERAALRGSTRPLRSSAFLSATTSTAVFLIPATAVCACLAAPRFALRPRTIAISACIVAAALTMYLFIIIRNRQGVWGEAPAWTIPELIRVVAGAEYYSDVMPNGWRGFAATIGPGVGAMFVREMSLAGLAIAALGIVVLWGPCETCAGIPCCCAARVFGICGGVYTQGVRSLPHPGVSSWRGCLPPRVPTGSSGARRLHVTSGDGGACRGASHRARFAADAEPP